MPAAGAGQFRARHFMAKVIFRHQHAGDGDLAAADMRMGIDAAGHDDAAMQRIFLIDLRAGGRRYDAAVLHENIADFAIDPVHGIVDLAASQLDEHFVMSRKG